MRLRAGMEGGRGRGGRWAGRAAGDEGCGVVLQPEGEIDPLPVEPVAAIENALRRYPHPHRRIFAVEFERRERLPPDVGGLLADVDFRDLRSEEHTSELQSLMRISYAVFCLKKKKN